MRKEYDFQNIEPKWQQFWQAQKVFRAANPGDPDFDRTKPKYYVLGMFPYPSGAGLHVGHPLSYTAVDIIARYKRMTGHNVLNPIGWDSFGLPAEQFAVKTGFAPQALTLDSINTFRRQLMSLGFSYDWSREVATSSSGYFKWTQWIFLQIFKAGLAVRQDAPVWWCAKLGTVLANEEVDENGLSEVGGHPCVRVPLNQWFMRITQYADRLLEDLDGLDWPEHIKELQRNWIGRSVGAEISFAVDGTDHTVTVFTTRPDTLYGCTFLLLAPEHPLVESLTRPDQAGAVAEYVAQAGRKSEIQRQAKDEKSGVFTGAFCVNPINGERVPVWISDYVLASYGTGAVMGVPAHDDRDFDFALAKGLEIRQVVAPPASDHPDIVRRVETTAGEQTCFVGDGTAVGSPVIDGLATDAAKERIVAVLEERGTGRKVIRYKLRDWLFSRQRYWGEPIPLVKRPDGEVVPVPEAELPVDLPKTARLQPTGEPTPPLALDAEWSRYLLPDGEVGVREPNVMPQWAGSCWYYLRFLDPGNTGSFCDPAIERYWMPVDMYIGGAEHAVLHLLYARFWHKALYDLGLVSHKEPFAGLFNQGMIQGEAFKAADGRMLPPGKVTYVDGRAVDAASGEEVSRVIVKMSKSLGNVVNPDEVVREYGADALRLYLMSMGPLEKNKPWDTQAISGVTRFLARLWVVVVGEIDSPHETPCRPHLIDPAHPADPEVERALHRAIAQVTRDIEGLRFNTAVSQLMIFVNHVAGNPERLTGDQAARFVAILSPFAPHMAEELWLRLARTDFLALAPWPHWDEALVKDEIATVAVQVNGKLRGTARIPADASEDEAVAAALAVVADTAHFAGRTVVKRIVVPGRLVNFVVK